jgi:ankyrin repeat protein
MSLKDAFKNAAVKTGSFLWDNIRGGNLTLRDAIEKHDWEKAGGLLQQNPAAADWDLEDASPIKRKPLHVAAAAGEFNIFTILLRPEFFKGDIDVRDSQGATPLIHAAREGHDLIVKALIAKGADVNAVDHLGRSALGCAAQYNRIVCLQLLLDQGAAINGPKDSRNPLNEAARAGYCRPAVKALIARGADPDYIGQLKESPLETCLREHNIEGAIELLQAGANPNNRNPETGAKLLQWAIAINHAAAMKMLLDGGADPLLPVGEEVPLSPLEYMAKHQGKVDDAIKKMVIERVARIELERNMAGVEKSMAAGTSARIAIKPIKLRLS